tara:strand:+ start:269 stop:1306 length:1038 start_codon:yes stop_codon:yes gene_type:complete
MAQQDITGLLTGIFAGDPAAQQQKLLSQQAVANNPNLLASTQTQIGRAPEQLARMRQNVGGMFGQDLRSSGQKVQEQLQGLDITTPRGQQQAVELISQIDPAKALALQSQFNDKNKAEQQAAELFALEQERNDIARERLSVDRRTLGAADTKAIRAATDKADEASGRVVEYNGLATAYEIEKPRGGLFGNAYEGWKSLVGGQDEVSRMKTGFAGVVVSKIIQSLPPGVASDKDIEMAKSGVMNASWNPEQIIQFLRGQAKLAAFLSERENMKATWMQKNGGSTAGFNDAWDAKRNEEGYRDFVQEKYSLAAYDFPREPVAFKGDSTAPSAPTPMVPLTSNQRMGR